MQFLDLEVFTNMIAHITLYGIDDLKQKWQSTKKFRNKELLVVQELDFSCTIIRKWGQSCHLWVATWLASEPVLISLLNAQYRIDQVSIDSTSWLIHDLNYLLY